MIGDADFTDIARASNTVPFTEWEKEVAFAFLADSRKKGRDLCVGAGSATESPDEMASLVGQGIFLFCSPAMLDAAFLFVKNDAGRSFFGKQKAVYSSYVGNVNGSGWMAGTVFKNWSIAITSIGNVYRHKGHA